MAGAAISVASARQIGNTASTFGVSQMVIAAASASLRAVTYSSDASRWSSQPVKVARKLATMVPTPMLVASASISATSASDSPGKDALASAQNQSVTGPAPSLRAKP